MQQLRKDLRNFIVDNFLFGQDDGSLADSTSFLQTGIIDSTGVLELIGFMEQQYGVHLADEEIVPENLDSLDNLVTFLSRKLPQVQGGSVC